MTKTVKLATALKYERAPISSLRLDPENLRIHPDKNIAAIEKSLARFGQQKPIVVDRDGVVLAGNGTLEAARRLGWAEIDVARTELAGAEARLFAIADNRSAELAEWDLRGLAAALSGLTDEQKESTGWSAAEVETLGSADWTPAPPGHMPTGEGPGTTQWVSVNFTQEQWHRLALKIDQDDAAASIVEALCGEA